MPAAAQCDKLAIDGMARAKALAAWKNLVRDRWNQVRVESVETGNITQVKVGSAFSVRARIHLGDLLLTDVIVELCMGQVDAGGKIVEAAMVPMKPGEPCSDGSFLYEANDVVCVRSGLHGYTLRVRPYNPDLFPQFMPGLITWSP